MTSSSSKKRLNEEIGRRERVIRIFPNEASAVRLIGALLAEQHEQPITGSRYFNMDEYFEWKKARPNLFENKKALSVINSKPEFSED